MRGSSQHTVCRATRWPTVSGDTCVHPTDSPAPALCLSVPRQPTAGRQPYRQLTVGRWPAGRQPTDTRAASTLSVGRQGGRQCRATHPTDSPAQPSVCRSPGSQQPADSPTDSWQSVGGQPADSRATHEQPAHCLSGDIVGRQCRPTVTNTPDRQSPATPTRRPITLRLPRSQLQQANY